MTKKLLDHFRAERWLYGFLTLHLICWTLVPAMIRHNLPLDAIEGTTWGHQLEWGYDKNPFLNGWLTALATYLDGQSGWMVYFFSQLSVVICLWMVWQIAKYMVPPVYALISVMLLEVIQYFNFHAIDFNDNTLELSLWGLCLYFFYRALREPKALTWMIVGFFAGLGMMAKYYTAVLLAMMTLFLIVYPENRKQLKTLPPYLGLITFFVVIIPHLVWLFSHDFVTITYVIARGRSHPSITNHFYFPAQFAWQQFEVFFPAILLYALLFIGDKPLLTANKTRLTSFNKAFLFYMGLGPFLLTLLLSLLGGIKLRAGWGMPLLSLWGLLLVALIQPHLTKTKIRGFFATVILLIGVLLGSYSVSLIHSPDPSSANFPGREIAEHITKLWHDTYHTPLSYVAGSRWVGGNVSFYSQDKPAVFINWNPKQAPWIDRKDLKQKGAVFVWCITDKEKLPKAIEAQFPELLQPTVLEFSWLRNKHHLPPIRIGVALLPPTLNP